MKRYVAVLSIIGLLLSCAHLTSTESTPSFDSIVTGQSDVEQDVQAVQEAVDKGGTVLLKGTFDFGPKGTVAIKNDVAVWGERDSNGRPLTKIMGPGAWAVGTVSWKSFNGSGNTIEWNDLRGFKASSADFYCTGNENTFIGPECKVVDKGNDNKILVMN